MRVRILSFILVLLLLLSFVCSCGEEEEPTPKAPTPTLSLFDFNAVLCTDDGTTVSNEKIFKDELYTIKLTYSLECDSQEIANKTLSSYLFFNEHTVKDTSLLVSNSKTSLFDDMKKVYSFTYTTPEENTFDATFTILFKAKSDASGLENIFSFTCYFPDGNLQKEDLPYMKEYNQVDVASCTFKTISKKNYDSTTTSLGNLTDQISKTSKEIQLSDGTNTGVVWTQYKLSDGGKYGYNTVNVAEVDLSNTHLSLDVINHGKYIVSSKTVSSAVSEYTQNNSSKTVLAAINGDLWMTQVHSSSTVTGKNVLNTTRGVLIIDHEVWASEQIDMENYAATNNEKGTTSGAKSCFGVTYDNQPLVGSPVISITLDTKDGTIVADGLNRLPCWDSLIVYNRRIMTNYALNDAYEVVIEMDDDAYFTIGEGDMHGKVVGIFPANDDSTKANFWNEEKIIVLTARGNKISLLENMQVGDDITFNMSLTDRYGHTELWNQVRDAMGGHITTILNGECTLSTSDSTKYPASFIGIKDDGTVQFVNITSSGKTRDGIVMKKAYEFLNELGFNSVFFLDGGGSSTFVTLESGKYKVRNYCCDGSERACINSIAVVWNAFEVCDGQGDLSYIEVPLDYSNTETSYMNGEFISEFLSSPNALTTSYDENSGAVQLTTTSDTPDPYITLCYDQLKPLSATINKYMVIRLKSSYSATTTFKLYLCAGSITGPTEACTKSFVVSGGEWQSIIVDLSSISNWDGTIHNIRLDVYDGITIPKNTTMSISYIAFCESEITANSISSGAIPEGAIVDFSSYKESLKTQ